MVEIVNLDEFFMSTMGGRPCQLDTSIYDGAEYDCGCGERHTFYTGSTKILRELPILKLVLQSDCDFCTLIQITGLFSYKFTSKISSGPELEQDEISDDFENISKEEALESKKQKSKRTQPLKGFKVIRKI